MGRIDQAVSFGGVLPRCTLVRLLRTGWEGAALARSGTSV